MTVDVLLPHCAVIAKVFPVVRLQEPDPYAINPVVPICADPDAVATLDWTTALKTMTIGVWLASAGTVTGRDTRVVPPFLNLTVNVEPAELVTVKVNDALIAIPSG